MSGAIGKRSSASSYMNVVAAHTAHLRHLSRVGTARLVLQGRHGYTKVRARSSGDLLAAHVRQALAFLDDAGECSARSRPLLQYYGYLNLAVAVLLVYQPPKYENYRRHGLQDCTANLKTLQLGSQVVAVVDGAVTAFHSVISCRTLDKRRYRLRELLCSIPMLMFEMGDAFGVRMHTVEIIPRREIDGAKDEGSARHIRLGVQYNTTRASGYEPPRLSRRRIERYNPLLTSAFQYVSGSPNLLRYQSTQQWKLDDTVASENAYRTMMRQLVNYGAQSVFQNDRHYAMMYTERGPLLPTLSAAMMLSFTLASVFRYRPHLVEKLQESRLNLLVDVFLEESAGFMVPAFRNLLYGEELVLQQRIEG